VGQKSYQDLSPKEKAKRRKKQNRPKDKQYPSQLYMR
jgi:hypothetical protein